MKTQKFNWYFVMMAFLVINISLTSCNEDDDKDMDDENKTETNTIIDIAGSDDSLSIFLQALTKANLVLTLKGSSEYTVFAPPNSAFQALFSDLGVSSIDDISSDDLKMILLYHVVAGSNSSSSFSTGYYSSVSPKESGYNYSLYFSKEELMLNGLAKVTQADIMADNGVIHVIDKLILPASITDHAIANPELSNLTAAVIKAELASTLGDDTNNFTVFAPTDDAFAMLFSDLNITLDDLSKEALIPILLYHVVNAFVPAADVITGYVNSLSMEQDHYLSLNIDVLTQGVMLNSAAKVILTDVVAANGIIHVIDQVILPNTVADIAINNSNFSILVEAVVKAELVETLSGEGPFTVFAPTNDAFNALFATLNISGISDLDKEALTPILMAHVVNGHVRSGDLSNSNVATLNAQKILSIDVSNSVYIDGDIQVVLADIQGVNGVVHAINKVIIP